MKHMAAVIGLFLLMAAAYYLIYKTTMATAICRDGMSIFSNHQSGTCSYHGGVKEWKR